MATNLQNFQPSILLTRLFEAHECAKLLDKELLKTRSEIFSLEDSAEKEILKDEINASLIESTTLKYQLWTKATRQLRKETREYVSRR